MTNEDAKKAKEVEEKLKEKKEEKLDAIQQTKKDVEQTLD